MNIVDNLIEAYSEIERLKNARLDDIANLTRQIEILVNERETAMNMVTTLLIDQERYEKLRSLNQHQGADFYRQIAEGPHSFETLIDAWPAPPGSETPCLRCKGTGIVVLRIVGEEGRNICPDCHGAGVAPCATGLAPETKP